MPVQRGVVCSTGEPRFKIFDKQERLPHPLNKLKKKELPVECSDYGQQSFFGLGSCHRLLGRYCLSN
jgi:hypothetical protein